MTLAFSNTLSGKKEVFKPLHPPQVRMYTCGPTVYDFAHIGNFRTYVFQDLLRRYLIASGYEVVHVMNITDIDDKTIAGARKKNVSLSEFTRVYTEAFREDLKALGILAPTREIHATLAIPKMIEVIACLLERNHAYVTNGSVYFRVASFPCYGMLSKKDLEKNIVGARVDQDEYEKEEGADFALWKKAKEGEPSWDSPWGAGRPGWHIECSTMSLDSFGWETLDIHTGGEDLVFPHHENEIAQSECATGKKFVNYWLHAKHLLVDGEKMSKSKGNFYTLRDLLAKGFQPAAIRYLLISTHYRKPLNFTLEGVQAAKESLTRVNDFWLNHFSHAHPHVEKGAAKGELRELVRKAEASFRDAMDDDLNVSGALGALFDLIKEVNSIPPGEISIEELPLFEEFLYKVNTVLNVFDFGELAVPLEILELAAKRQQARDEKNFKLSDDLRRQILEKGWRIEDVAGGYKLKKAT